MPKPTAHETYGWDRFYGGNGAVPAMLGVKPPKQRKKPVHKESREQIAVIDWWGYYAQSQGIHPFSLFMIPNGSGFSGGFSKNMLRVGYMRRMGLRPGACDLMLAIPSRTYNGAFIEMKSETGRASDEQIAFIDLVRDHGYFAAVCQGADEAIATIKGYLE